MNGTILLAEDEAIARKNISRLLQQEGYTVHEVGDGTEAINAVDRTDFDVVITDIKMPGADGLAVLRHVREVSPQTFTFIMTAFASVETAVQALHLGAHDYLLKPIVLDDLLRKVGLLLDHKEQSWEIQQLRRQLSGDTNPTELLVGRSRAMQYVVELIEKVAGAPSSILITGESGVGKEVVARAIHLRSVRASKIFLPVNCGAIPEGLLESQLFGHAKGAFTNAVSAQQGLFQHAHGGTLFLDEIGDMPLPLQVKLLRVLQEREVLPLGTTVPIKVDVRILAATNHELEKEVRLGRFREELYYRLNVISIHIPPLRERLEDIPQLVEHLIRRHNQELSTSYKGVDSAAMRLLMSLTWKGNIRELDNVLERAMILGNGEWVTPSELPQQGGREEAPPPQRPVERRLKEAVHAYEKSHIESVLQETKGDRTRAAELLGLSRSSLYRKMEQVGIPLNDI
jgi:DNA-binding NtrC family response regulator